MPKSTPRPSANPESYLPPSAVDFTITSQIRQANAEVLPSAIYDRYRARLQKAVCAGAGTPLLVFMGEVIQNDRFMAAYFHPTEDVLLSVAGPFGATPEAIASAQLDDRPFRRALSIAERASRASELSGEDQALARVLAFLHPCGLLYNLNVMRRAGVDLKAFTRTTFSHDHGRYLRSRFLHEPLKVLNVWSPALAFFLSAALDERRAYRSTNDQHRERAARVASVLAWSHPQLLIDLYAGKLTGEHLGGDQP